MHAFFLFAKMQAKMHTYKHYWKIVYFIFLNIYNLNKRQKDQVHIFKTENNCFQQNQIKIISISGLISKIWTAPR